MNTTKNDDRRTARRRKLTLSILGQEADRSRTNKPELVDAAARLYSLASPEAIAIVQAQLAVDGVSALLDLAEFVSFASDSVEQMALSYKGLGDSTGLPHGPERQRFVNLSGKRTHRKVTWKTIAVALHAAIKAERIAASEAEHAERLAAEEAAAAEETAEVIGSFPATHEGVKAAAKEIAKRIGERRRAKADGGKLTVVGGDPKDHQTGPVPSRIKSIEVSQGEGVAPLLHATVNSFHAANALLRLIADRHTGPGYRKVDLDITWENGETIRTRHDVYSSPDVRNEKEHSLNAAKHARAVLRFFVDKYETASAQAILDGCDLGKE